MHKLQVLPQLYALLFFIQQNLPLCTCVLHAALRAHCSNFILVCTIPSSPFFAFFDHPSLSLFFTRTQPKCYVVLSVERAFGIINAIGLAIACMQDLFYGYFLCSRDFSGCTDLTLVYDDTCGICVPKFFSLDYFLFFFSLLPFKFSITLRDYAQSALLNF